MLDLLSPLDYGIELIQKGIHKNKYGNSSRIPLKVDMHVKMLSLSTYTLKLRLPSYCFSVRWHLVRGIDKLPMLTSTRGSCKSYSSQ